MSDIDALIAIAEPLVNDRRLGRDDTSAGSVAAAIRTTTGNVYTGICVDVSCGIGFCAEHSAIAEMLKGGETQIAMAVAVCADGVLAPCGRCREFMMLVDPRNAEALVGLPGRAVTTLRELLPHHWSELWSTAR